MKEDNYTVLIDYSFNGVPEKLYSGNMSKYDCEEFIEEVINEKEWVNVYKKLSTKEQLKKFINVHNIASMTVVKLFRSDEFNYGVVDE